MKQNPSNWAWSVCGLLLLATMLNYMDRQALAVTLPLLKAEYNLVESRVGWLEASFGFSFAFGSIFFGWLADRVGPRILYPLILTGWSAAGIATALAGQPWLTDALQSSDEVHGTGVYRWLLICRVALGVCEAGHWPCALLTIRAILTPKDRTLGNGILQSGASLGAISVPLYIELAERAGQSWEFPFWSIGLVGLLWVPAWFLLVGRTDLRRSKEEIVTQVTAASPSDDDSAVVPAVDAPAGQTAIVPFLLRVLTLGIIVSTLVISWQFLRAWLGLFLQDYHGYSRELTRGLMSGYFIAADVGCILAGVYVTRVTRAGMSVDGARKSGYLIFALLTACGAAVPFVGNGWLMICLLFIAAAGILGLHPFYYALTQEISASRMGLLSGLLAAFAWCVSSLSQIYLGAHIEATKSYQLGLVIVGLAPMVGLIALLVLWPKPEPVSAKITELAAESA